MNWITFAGEVGVLIAILIALALTHQRKKVKARTILHHATILEEVIGLQRKHEAHHHHYDQELRVLACFQRAQVLATQRGLKLPDDFKAQLRIKLKK